MICPICKENCLIEINDFKITFHKCKNDHISKDIYLHKFEETQTINLNEIICDICKNNNRGNTHENKFYICNNCNKNLCILCKQNHDKNHKILNYIIKIIYAKSIIILSVNIVDLVMKIFVYFAKTII